MAVSPINTSYSIASVTGTKIQSKELVFAKAKISINGVNVQIGGSTEETARKINRVKDKTGVEARVVTSSSGIKTIQLVVKRGNNLRINDQSGVLKGLVGTSDKHLIKVIKANGQGKVSLQYSINAQEHHNNTEELYLRSSREHVDSRKKANNHPPVPVIADEEVAIDPFLDMPPLEEMPKFAPPPVVRDIPRSIRLDSVEVKLGQDPLSIIGEHSRLQGQERLNQERIREYQERMAERINSHAKRINDCASSALGEVISDKGLFSTPREVVENVQRWIGEAIRDFGLRDKVLLAKGEQLRTLVSKEIIDKRSWFSSAFKDILDISEKDTKKAVRIAISKLK